MRGQRRIRASWEPLPSARASRFQDLRALRFRGGHERAPERRGPRVPSYGARRGGALAAGCAGQVGSGRPRAPVWGTHGVKLLLLSGKQEEGSQLPAGAVSHGDSALVALLLCSWGFTQGTDPCSDPHVRRAAVRAVLGAHRSGVVGLVGAGVCRQAAPGRSWSSVAGGRGGHRALPTGRRRGRWPSPPASRAGAGTESAQGPLPAAGAAPARRLPRGLLIQGAGAPTRAFRLLKAVAGLIAGGINPVTVTRMADFPGDRTARSGPGERGAPQGAESGPWS